MVTQQPVTVVGINITDVVTNAGDKGVTVFMEISYANGVPLLTGDAGQKKQVGYEWVQSVMIDADGLPMPSTNRGNRFPIRRVFETGDGEYKMQLRTNDSAAACLESLAQVLVESQGIDYIGEPATVSAKPALTVTYASAGLEVMLKRL